MYVRLFIVEMGMSVCLQLITCPLLYYIDTEREAARITSSILSAVAYLHQRSITHR
jgi:serine/threonine protein kinase